ILAWNQSTGFVYAYYVLRIISFILSQGSIFCIAIAYSADVVEENKRAAAFSWITGLCAASHVLGNLLALFLPEKYIFPVSIALLIFCPVYMQLFLVETVKLAPKRDQDSACLTTPIKIIQKRYNAMKDAATIVMSSPTLRGISLVAFFFELGKSGINYVLMYYLKAAFGFDKNEFSEILMLVGFGSIISQMLVLPLINPLVGEKVILCIGILASIAYALFNGLAWAPWVPFMGATFKVVVVLVRPATYAIISRASSSNDQGKTQGFVAGVESLSSLLSPLVMSPLTSWFLSSSAPFNCKGFSIICASVCMYYLKAAYGFDKNECSEILMIMGFGSIISQMLALPLINPPVGENVILCIGILASIAYVPSMGATFKVEVVLVRPAGKAQGFVAGVESLSSLLSPLVMSPLTSWFLSNSAPFNCQGFSIICASTCMMISLCFACLLELGAPSSKNSEDDIESPLLTSATSTTTPPALTSTHSSDNHHWMVLMEAPPQGVNSKPQVTEYCVKTLERVLGSEKDAQMCVYDASWDTHFGFCCDSDEETSRELAGLPGVLSVRPDPDYSSVKKDYSFSSIQSSYLSSSQIGSNLFFPVGSTKNWLVRMDKLGIGVVTKAQMVDYYAQILTKVLGNEKDAQMCIYHVSWQSNFGFCCELDDECAQELAGVPGVLSVQLDKNFESENKNYGGLYVFQSKQAVFSGNNLQSNLQSSTDLPDPSEASQTIPIKTKKLFVTGLSFYTSEKTLRAAFEGFGELVEGMFAFPCS
ncbi:organelle rrm domain-containing protein 1, partial [Quercus suber]